MSGRIVGIVLVHNEDVFVEQAIRNVADFCDRIHAVDHMSTDGTWNVLQALAAEYEQLEVRRARHAGESHALIESYAGTDTWVFGVDGDELYDPGRLAGFRNDLLGGAYRESFKLASNVLNCVELDRRRAAGYLSPPSRSITKLYNFGAIEAWSGDGSERLHGGTIAFRPRFHERAVDNIGERLSWDETPLRCLHACFLRRSSLDIESESAGRPILEHSGMHDRSLSGALKRKLRRHAPPAETADWKRQKYMRGDLVTVDATPFFS
jgi:glycosyltransferase involved in cell wall biosynthesis